MKFRLSLVSAAMLIALLASLVPLAGASVQPAAAASVCDAAQFVADVTVADGSVFAPGAAFKKTWRLKNAGTCTWSTSYSLVYASGEKMGSTLSVAMPKAVAPGESVDVSVDMSAPSAAGKYRGNWQLKNASGVLFGIGSKANGVFWVEIVVSSGGTSTGAAYNFADKACDAAWTSGAGTLACPGADGDAKGFVLKQATPKLENGVADANPGLLVMPQAVNNGFIQAAYPAFRVQSGDKFQATVSCEGGATACYVQYRLDYQIGSGAVKTFWTFREKFEGQYYRANLDLTSLAGQDVKFILYVSAYGSPTGDRALWGNPIIFRSGSTVTPVPTTPAPTTPVTPTSGCDKAQFVADISIPDGTSMNPGATFKKTWRLKNIGTCTWTTSYMLVFSSGEQMGAPSSAAFPTSVAPGQTVDLTLNMVAPNAGGTYRGNWMLKNAAAQTFGIGSGANKPFWVEIKVSGPTATPGAPTVTPTGATPTQQPGAAYDFVANLCNAKWESGAGVLPCPGADNDIKGFALKVDSPKLESGATDTRPGLLTNPQAVTNGYIKGTFPAFRVQQGDRFKTIVNCQYGATGCFVTFRIDYLVGSDTTVQHMWTFGEKYEGQYYEYDKDLSFLAGKDVKFILIVTAGTATAGQRAMWVAPRIARAGASAATPVATISATAVPPSATVTTSPVSGWNTYQSANYGFDFKYPPGSATGAATNNSARIYLPFTVGTLLVEKYVDVSVVEGANPCKNTVSGGGAVATSGNVTINGVTFLKETGSGVATSNIYDWEAYSVVRPNTTACVSIAFVLHSVDPGVYPTPPPPAFDKAAESAVFATILSTFVWFH
ncbi:MAG: hypothetical protein HFACDABA_02460 [Anaerolineales bacterium]|nr:hypothetical protein [Anaerolineales bacterium]